MCGIVAVDISDISSDQIEEVKRLLIETEIRGKHASGISWFSDGKVHTVKASMPISDLLQEFDIERCVGDTNGRLAMIAHIRYSTSDLDFNQPIGDEKFSIVHNGVITQKDPTLWHNEFRLGAPKGRNDSELVHMALVQGVHPLVRFDASSMAVATLSYKGHVRAFRNGKRPMWITNLYNGNIVTSTRDIVERAGVDYSAQIKAVAGVDYNLTLNKKTVVVVDMEDLQ